MCIAVATIVSARPSGARNSPESMELDPSGSNIDHTASTTERISSTFRRSLDRRNVLISARITSPFSKVPESSSSKYANLVVAFRMSSQGHAARNGSLDASRADEVALRTMHPCQTQSKVLALQLLVANLYARHRRANASGARCLLFELGYPSVWLNNLSILNVLPRVHR
jgi:hypothetical protein